GEATHRWRRRPKPDWCCTTRAASATRPSRRFSTGCRTSNARPERARSSACWGAWRNRKGRRSSTARRTSRWWPAVPAIRGWVRCWCSSRLATVASLLAGVAAVPGIRRVRYTTSHPRDFVRGIMDAMDANPVLCDHVHLPVQSGSTKVLAAMDRLYTRDEYMRRIDWIKTARRDYA